MGGSERGIVGDAWGPRRVREWMGEVEKMKKREKGCGVERPRQPGSLPHFRRLAPALSHVCVCVCVACLGMCVFLARSQRALRRVRTGSVVSSKHRQRCIAVNTALN